MSTLVIPGSELRANLMAMRAEAAKKNASQTGADVETARHILLKNKEMKVYLPGKPK